MNMGAVKRFWNRVNPVYAAALATTDSYTVSPTQAVTGYGLYETWRVRFPGASTATSPNILISSLPAQPIRKYSNGSVVNLLAGDIQGQDHSLYWDGTEFILSNPASITSIADATNGGLNFSAATGAVTAKVQPSDLLTKGSPTNADSIVIMDAAASNVAKTATIPAVVGALFSPITNSLSGDVALNNVSNYFDGPSVAQGSTGTWFVSGTVTVLDTGSAAGIDVKLWDGTTVIASTILVLAAINSAQPVSLSGYIASPAGNLRISCKDVSATTGAIKFNSSGNSKDSTITAIRIA